MTRDDIQLLYEYDRWANKRVLNAVSALSAEQFTHDLGGGGFRSVRDTLVHIIGGEWIWLEYWKEPPHSSALLADLRKRRDALFNPGAFPNVAAVQSRWVEVEKEQAEFVNRVTNESLEKVLAFRTTQIRLAHPEVLQSYVADLLGSGLSAKYVRNIVSMMSAMWDVAVSWKYVSHRPFADLILPECDPPDAEPYSAEEVTTIFQAASEPLRTFLWILGESGMRPAEVCAIHARYIHLDDRVISVRQSESLGCVVRPKTVAGYRDFAISPQLVERLRKFLGDKKQGLLFVSRTGRPWRESKVVEKRLNPLLARLGIKQRGLKGFRHFNATEMDSKNVPVKTRQTRLGHDDPRMTLGMRNKSGYTHMIGEDDRRVAAMFGTMFSKVLRPDASEREYVSPHQMSLAF